LEAELKIADRGSPFRVAIHGQGIEIADPVRSLVEDRVRRALRAFAGRIAGAQVRLWSPMEGNAPVVCHVRVELRPRGGLALGETGPDLAMAVNRAARRLSAALQARLARPGVVSQAWLR
jgi:ribosome-associated translation inhibitor RaiA